MQGHIAPSGLVLGYSLLHIDIIVFYYKKTLTWAATTSCQNNLEIIHLEKQKQTVDEPLQPMIMHASNDIGCSYTNGINDTSGALNTNYKVVRDNTEAQHLVNRIYNDITAGINQGWGQVQYLYLVLVLKYIFIST